jgi:hypothetical protein
MDATSLLSRGLTGLDNIIIEAESLLGRLKQARAALNPSGQPHRSSHNASAVARAPIDVGDQHYDPMSDALRSIIRKATRLPGVHNSAIFRTSSENQRNR